MELNATRISIATAVADVNGDGNLDVVSADTTPPNQISVYLGSGTGTFNSGTSFPAGTDVRFVAVADFNSDGNADVAALHAAGFSILLGNGAGSFAAPVSFASASGTSLAAGLFDANAFPDVAVAGTAGVQIFLNQCTAVPPPSIALIDPNSGSASGGQTVTITGTNLGNATVTFGGRPAAVLSNNGTTLVVITPSHPPGPVAVVVTTPGGTATGTFTFVAVPPQPAIPTLGTTALLALACALALVAAWALR